MTTTTSRRDEILAAMGSVTEAADRLARFPKHTQPQRQRLDQLTAEFDALEAELGRIDEQRHGSILRSIVDGTMHIARALLMVRHPTALQPPMVGRRC